MLIHPDSLLRKHKFYYLFQNTTRGILILNQFYLIQNFLNIFFLRSFSLLPSCFSPGHSSNHFSLEFPTNTSTHFCSLSCVLHASINWILVDWIMPMRQRRIANCIKLPDIHISQASCQWKTRTLTTHGMHTCDVQAVSVAHPSLAIQ
jgi:hypothetical protein